MITVGKDLDPQMDEYAMLLVGIIFFTSCVWCQKSKYNWYWVLLFYLFAVLVNVYFIINRQPLP